MSKLVVYNIGALLRCLLIMAIGYSFGGRIGLGIASTVILFIQLI